MTFIPTFSEPESHWPRAPPPPARGQSGGEARAAGVAPSGNPTISPHTGRTGPHPRFSNSSIRLQLRHRGDENGDHPGRNRPAWCGNPDHAGRSLIGWGSKKSQRHPGTTESHPRIKNPSIHIQLRLLGDENGNPRVETAPNVVQTPVPLADR